MNKLIYVVKSISAAALIVGISATAWSASEYDEEIERLERELRQIAEMAADGADVRDRVTALEGQIAALKQDVDTTGTVAVSDDSDAAEEPGVQGTPNPLQRNNETQFLTGDDLLDQAFPDSLPIPGSDVRFKIGGYVKADLIQDFDPIGDRYEFELATIPVSGTPEAALDGQTTMSAKETRVNFDFRKVARNEEHGWEFPLQVFVEFDFFDDRDSFRLQPRMRHAYGVVGRFLAGRTWTVTTDLSVLNPTIDFSGGDSLYGGRVSQFRFADRINDSLSYGIGLEESAASIGNPFGVDGAGRSSLPNLGGFLRWSGASKAHVQLGVDVFRLEWQGGVTGPDETEIGYGASLTTAIPLGELKRNRVSFAATAGSGAAHKVVSLSFDGGNSAVVTPGGRLDKMSHWQVYGGYSHYWTDSLNSAVVFAHAELDNSEFQSGNAIHQASSVHVNLIWFPYKSVSTGVEYMWGRRENADGADGTANRIQFMAKFVF
jgi:hypothetical protein